MWGLEWMEHYRDTTLGLVPGSGFCFQLSSFLMRGEGKSPGVGLGKAKGNRRWMDRILVGIGVKMCRCLCCGLSYIAVTVSY